ncbi:TRAP transporter small permease [Sulfurospirillum barnesii]|uniref:TRAP-type C4-dicarboxylate transport system, small permease component n=1 Tax=Sulfurospirillum barnesii (strain ATCC 700032 / DSM 10660 / SES-3) TaxID=760154 RepID=I3XV57_SULBS|nr:TRAP transporter small permease [Sulfurospirillum barnesii]AFL67831.1 TRAP-type C4-dicarboxylate transport system, small permease component [Sulfurospirillum barnesii SES-3]
MRKYFTILDLGVMAINKNIAVFGIALGVILAFTNVVLRYFFEMSLTWAGELTNYLFMWSALFGAAYGFKKGVHISVTMLLEKLPPMMAKVILMGAHLFSCLYLGLMAYLGYELTLMMIDFGEMSIDLRIPMWIPHLVLPFAFIGASFRAGEKIFEVAEMNANNVVVNHELEAIKDSLEIRGVKDVNA